MDKAEDARGLFGERLRAARAMRRMSLRALGVAVGVSHQTLRNYEQGKAMPDSAVLARISKALGQSLDYFVRRRRVDLSEVRFYRMAFIGECEAGRIEECGRARL